MRSLALALAWLTISGCTLANLTPQARFTESTHTLNDASRWGRVDIASESVSPRYRERFLARHQGWGQDITIADADITRMQLAEDHKSALSEVRLSWIAPDRVSLRTSTVEQRWEAEHGRFLLVDEVVRAGDPRVFIEEPAPADDAAASAKAPKG